MKIFIFLALIAFAYTSSARASVCSITLNQSLDFTGKPARVGTKTEILTWNLADKMARGDAVAGAGEFQSQLMGLLGEAQYFNRNAGEQVLAALNSINDNFNRLTDAQKNTVVKFLSYSSTSLLSQIPRSSWSKIPTIISDAKKNMQRVYSLYALLPSVLTKKGKASDSVFSKMDLFNSAAEYGSEAVPADQAARLAFTNDTRPILFYDGASRLLQNP